MTGLLSLWLPILLSAVAVFVVSSLLNSATPWHKNDFRAVPDEGRVMDALRPFSIAPGDYAMPRATSMEEMKSAQYGEKRAKGPVVVMTVLPNGPVAIGPSLALWFLYSVVIGVLVAYVAGRALPPGAPYLRVFQVVSVATFLAYAAALWQGSIWLGRSWGATLRSTIDGLIYALITAGMFGWLWPR